MQHFDTVKSYDLSLRFHAEEQYVHILTFESDMY